MKRLVIFVLFYIASAVTSLRAQCPMCKTALTSNRDMNGKNEATVGNGINKGILFLLATPYVLVGTAGLFYYQNFKKKRAQRG